MNTIVHVKRTEIERMNRVKSASRGRAPFTALTAVIVTVAALVVPLIFGGGTVYASGNPPTHVIPAPSGGVDCLHGCHPSLKHGVTRKTKTYRAPNGQYITASNLSGGDPIYMVHGIDAFPSTSGLSCTAGLWGSPQSYLGGTHPGLGSDTITWGAPIYKIGFYNGDSNCDMYISTHNNPYGNFWAPSCNSMQVYGSGDAAAGLSTYSYSNTDSTVGTTSEPIEHIACELAWQIYDHDTQYGRNVKIVAHSMGGLIVRYMINRVQAHDNAFPSSLYVSDVVTFSTPHAELYSYQQSVPWFACGGCNQSNEMGTDTKFMIYIRDYANHPDATASGASGGTDWTMLGSLGADPLDWDYQATFMSNSNGLSNNHRIGYGSNSSPAISCNGQSQFPNGYDHGDYMKDSCDAFDAPYFYCDGCSRDKHSWFNFTSAAPHSLHEMLFAFTYYNW